jgi:hypothetical protein
MSRESGSPEQPKVGYKNPPKEHRIQPGERRNPRGRPRKLKTNDSALAANLEQIIVEELGRRIPQQDGTEIELVRRIVQSVVLKAAKGSLPASRLALSELRRVEQRERDKEDEVLRLAYQYRYEGLAKFDYHRRHQLEPPDIIPHPAHIVIEGRNVRFAGPIDHEGELAWERLKRCIVAFTEDLAWARKRVRELPGEAWAEQALASAQRLRRKAMRMVPKGWDWREQIWNQASVAEERARYALIRKYKKERAEREQD